MMITKPYKEPLAALKAKKAALRAANRIPTGYMEYTNCCDDVACNLCYKFANEKSPQNKK